MKSKIHEHLKKSIYGVSKKLNLTFVLTALAISISFAQAPQSFKYQAVARDISGNALVSQNIGLQISIIQTSPAGTAVYIEVHTATTNQFGLFNLELGSGFVSFGSFSSIDWGSDLHFVKVEMDETGGTSYQLMGTSQLLSVPYALYAENAGNIGDADSTNELQILSISGSDLTISNGNTITLPDSVDDADADPVNELQAISISNDTIYLSDGGFAILPPDLTADADADSTNELQTLSIANDTLSISNGNSVPITDLDSTNELQMLTMSGDTIFISSTNYIVIPGLSSIHGDPNFEFVCGGVFTDPRDGESYATVQIGGQCWMAENLNIGTQISTGDQLNNAIIEKYCSGNDAANCITYGALYQWNEMMQYSTTPGVQGVCPSGWHLPTDVEWMTMEEVLGMCTGTGGGCSGAAGWRGTTEGDQLKNVSDCFGGSDCGISGFEESLGGFRQPVGTYSTPGTKGYIWTSNASSGTAAWRRYIFASDARVDRNNNNKLFGFSVRCVKD